MPRGQLSRHETYEMSKPAIYHVLKRGVDLAFVLLSAPFVLFLSAIIAIAVKTTSPGPVLYWSERIGIDGHSFQMPKFRTMQVGTPPLATHLLADPSAVLTPIGGFLRQSSLDEIPQLWSIFIGDMTLVGPRPALFNQADLIALRRKEGVERLVPGITGLAQVMGRDDLPISTKVGYDREYLEARSIWFDLKILMITVLRVIRREGIKH